LWFFLYHFLELFDKKITVEHCWFCGRNKIKDHDLLML
jgi:hypothetical protein